MENSTKVKITCYKCGFSGELQQIVTRCPKCGSEQAKVLILSSVR